MKFTDRFLQLPCVTQSLEQINMMGPMAEERIEIIKMNTNKIEAYRAKYDERQGIMRSVIQLNGQDILINLTIGELEEKLNSFNALS